MAKNPYGSLGPSPGRVAKINKLNKPKKKPVAKRPPLTAPPLRPPTRASLNPIDARVQGEISPLMQALMFEREQKRDYNSRLMRDLGGFTNAVMGRLGGIAPQIGNAYQGAAGAQQAFGTGYGNALNADQAADAGRINAVLQSIGAPEGQLASGGDAGGVLAGLAGWIPSQMLSAQGDALAGAAANLPNDASVQAQVSMHKLLNQAIEDDAGFGSEVQALLSKVPGLRAEFQSEQGKLDLAYQKQKLDQFNDDRNYWLKMQAYYQSTGKLKLSQQAAKRAAQAEKRYANASAGLDAWGNVAPGYVRQPDGTIVKRYAPKAKPKAKGAAGLTPNAQSEILQKVLGKEKDIVKRDLPELAKQTGLLLLLKDKNAPPKEVARLKKSVTRGLWVRYSPFATTPASKRALRAMINRLVKNYKGGGGGLLDGLDV